MLSNAKALTQKFRSLGNYFENLNKQIRNEVDNSLESVNNIIAEIAELNDKIERRHLSEKDTNSLKDLRNKYFTELSQFVSVTTENRQNGVVDVVCSSIPVVVGSSALSLKADTTENGKLGVAVEGTYNYYTDIRGGDIGALLSLSNDYIADVEGKIDDLACAITNQINKYHVQGVGSFGSFESISGWKNDSGQLSDFGRISDGSFFIRVKNTQTGIITREEINVDKENDTLSDIAARISNITGLSADVSSENILSINSDSQYEFDFTPALLSEPDTSNLNGNAGSDIPSISVSGIFNGTENTDYTFSVQGAGQTGSTENLQIRIEKDGQFLKNIDIGSGYPVKDSIEVEQGIYISLGAGQVNAGEEFTIKALSDSDTSGLLSAAGMNTFFSAQSASDMKVCSAVQDNPQRIATSITADMTDSENANKMAAVRDEPVQELGFLSVVGFYHRTVTNLGQEINIKEMDQQNLQSMVQNLKNEQSEISGVDINEQAAQLMLFQQMYQGMAKYMVSVRDVTNSLMELV
jgi:flagellar hook-associated protein 1 FlgK